MPPKEKSPWLLKLELIKSLSLVAIADEINTRRLSALNDLLADTTRIKRASQDRRKREGGGDQYGRLLKLVEQQGWPLYQLPSDMRADANRMKRYLIALHSRLGNQRCRQLSDEEIAEEMCVSPRTARRGAQDCREAFLVDVAEHNRAPASGGGRDLNGFMIVWPTLADLAEGPRVQSLFEPSLPAEMTQRDERILQPENPVRPFDDFGHSGETHGHSGETHGHSGLVRNTARAPSPLSLSNLNTSSSSLHLPPRTSRRKDKEEEDLIFLRNTEWKLAYEALKTYPVGDSARAIRSARLLGWTAEQVLEFIAECKAKVINGRRAWEPGQVWWQLKNGSPGSRISMQPSELYRREKRNHEIALERKRREAKAAEETAPRQKSSEIDPRIAEQFEAMLPDQIAELATAAGPYVAKYYRNHGLTTVIRQVLLDQLQRNSLSMEAEP